MTEDSGELLVHVREIRKLLELLAEPAIEKRDAKLRETLRQIVGRSEKNRSSVFLMNGKRRQKDIRLETGIQKGNLSTLVGRLSDASLLVGDPKAPALAISIPENFFSADSEGH